MFAAVDIPLSDGALYRIAPPSSDAAQTSAEIKVEGLDFANGFFIDEECGELYLSETMADRVLGFKLDLSTVALSDRRVVAEMLSPDNIEQADSRPLWVAYPIPNEVVLIDPESADIPSLFPPATADRRSAMLSARPLLVTAGSRPTAAASTT